MTPEESRQSKQKKAIRRLENAFKACKDANINFFGMDNQLLWVDGDVRQEIFDAEHPLYRHVLHYADMPEENGGTVNDHGCYVDSGGA